jgi:hypothetical protein
MFVHQWQCSNTKTLDAFFTQLKTLLGCLVVWDPIVLESVHSSWEALIRHCRGFGLCNAVTLSELYKYPRTSRKNDLLLNRVYCCFPLDGVKNLDLQVVSTSTDSRCLSACGDHATHNMLGSTYYRKIRCGASLSEEYCKFSNHESPYAVHVPLSSVC